MFYCVWYNLTDNCTYNCKEILGYARTEIGAIQIEDEYKKKLGTEEIYITKESFIEDAQREGK